MFSRGSKASNAGAVRSVKEQTPSIISTSLRITGNIETGGDIHLDGIIDGDVMSQNLTVGEEAVINGAVICDVVRIAGKVNGDISSRVVELTRTARVVGDINHETLAIEAGAYVQGLCRHVEAGLAENRPADPVKPSLIVAEPAIVNAMSAGVRAGDVAAEPYMASDQRTGNIVG